MRKKRIVVLAFTIPIMLILVGLSNDIDILVKIGLFVLLFYIVLGVFYGQDNVR